MLAPCNVTREHKDRLGHTVTTQGVTRDDHVTSYNVKGRCESMFKGLKVGAGVSTAQDRHAMHARHKGRKAYKGRHKVDKVGQAS